MLTRRTAIATLCLALCCMFPGCATDSDSQFVLYLVRHAEKIAEPGNPPLSPAGEQRAQWLAQAMAGNDIRAIWSSNYIRTRATGAPLAGQLGLEIELYDPRALPGLAEALLAAGQNALVVGHSNTTPELAKLLCGCEVAPMQETEYERLLTIVVDRDGRHLAEYNQREFFAGTAQP